MNGTQPYSATWSKVSVIWKCMSEIWGIPSAYKSGPQNHLFGPTSQLKGKFNGLYLRKETDIDSRSSVLTTARGLLYRPKMPWTLVHKRLKIRSKFSPTFRKFCIELPTRCTRKPNITKRCQMGRNKWRWCEPNMVAPHTECKCNHRN